MDMNSPTYSPEHLTNNTVPEVQQQVNSIIMHLECTKTRYEVSYADRNRGDRYGDAVFDDSYSIEVRHQIETEHFVGTTTPPDICLVLEGLIKKLQNEAPQYTEKSQIHASFVGFLNYNWSGARSEGLKYAIPVVEEILKEIGW